MTAEEPEDSFPSLEEVLQQLIDDLNRIENAPSDPGENPDNEDPLFDERAQIMGTVASVAKFMQSLPALTGKERERPLVTLLSNLLDVHEGRKSDLLSPYPKPGRKKPPLEVQFSRARAAAAMEFFIRAGNNNEEAARLASSGSAKLFHARPLYKQVARWRDEFTGAMDHDGARYYRAAIASVEVRFSNPEHAARCVLGARKSAKPRI